MWIVDFVRPSTNLASPGTSVIFRRMSRRRAVAKAIVWAGRAWRFQRIYQPQSFLRLIDPPWVHHRQRYMPQMKHPERWHGWWP